MTDDRVSRVERARRQVAGVVVARRSADVAVRDDRGRVTKDRVNAGERFAAGHALVRANPALFRQIMPRDILAPIVRAQLQDDLRRGIDVRAAVPRAPRKSGQLMTTTRGPGREGWRI